MNAPRRLRPVPAPEPAPIPVVQPDLLFCAVCQVSVPRAELENGVARLTPRGRIFCGICAKATPEQRAARRAALEEEFADDAPISRPVAVEPPPIPVAPPRSDALVLDARVGELERAAFRLQARMTSLEERLEAVLRRMG